MDYRLSVFRAVAQRQHFTRAADDLDLSQPAVSKHIRLLEAEWGVQLFHRLGSRVELTDAGRILADYAERVAVLAEEARRVLAEMAGLQRGYLRIGASATPGLYLLPEVLARFQVRYPGLEVTLAISNSADVARRVLDAECDLGFVGAPTEAAGLQVRPFAEDEIILIVPPGHALVQQRVLAPEIFAGATLILREAGSGTRQLVEAHLASLGLRPKRTLELPGCEAVKRAVAAGLGLAWIARRAVTLEIAHGLICAPEIPALRISRRLCVLTRKDARPTAASLAFLALVLQEAAMSRTARS
ncbi:MAG: lysR-type protein [Chloroflexota bacterium]|nr:lysR-type protein [Chloroflexota bacterium]